MIYDASESSVGRSQFSSLVESYPQFRMIQEQLINSFLIMSQLKISCFPGTVSIQSVAYDSCEM